MRIHLDTDFGGDPDDACALVMLLGSSDVEVVAITTTLDIGGERAACVLAILRMCGRDDIPVVQGATSPLRSSERFASTAHDRRYWPEGISPSPSPDGEAASLIAGSVKAGAMVVAIGPYTNLAVAEERYPGTLRSADVVVMGGWVTPPADGFPQWGPDRDFNVQTDVEAAKVVFEEAGDLTLSTLPETMPAQLTEAQLSAISGGAVGELLARQSRLHAEASKKSDLQTQWPAIEDDFVNFHWDPVACGVAIGSEATTTVDRRLDAVVAGGALRFVPSTKGRPVRALERVDPGPFADAWVAAVRVADR